MKAETLDPEDIEWATRSAQAYCTKRRIDPEDAKDVIQNALLALVRCWRRYQPILGPFRTYASSRVWGAMFDTARETFGRPGSARCEAMHMDIDTAPDIEARVCAGWRAATKRVRTVRRRKALGAL